MTETIRDTETSIGGTLELVGNAYKRDKGFSVTLMVAEILSEQGYSFKFKDASDKNGNPLPNMTAIWVGTPAAKRVFKEFMENSAVRSLIGLSHPTVLPKPSSTGVVRRHWSKEAVESLDALYFHQRAKGFIELAPRGEKFRDKIKEALDQRDRLLSANGSIRPLPDFGDIKKLVLRLRIPY